ncbi:branched-chain amino acid ABC transporter permease [Pseudomonas sp. TH39(2020)]|uniref:branched-chain amino acid ABC transporter permease n=1 Tax=Pseudomonas sp. TH39(2020) TaxID=2796349 RepID=UPI001914BB7D|nr:branched-chain amino acid ABC transporter permease [Pseudomonas sp. TH39(2020)]MBK5401447.1 branched-chain amino acid ABC transporter permease [Pseudomonas sp. TH39(2020)]
MIKFLSNTSRPLLITALALSFLAGWALLHAESQIEILVLGIVIAVLLGVSRHLGIARPLGLSAGRYPQLLGMGCIVGVLVLLAVFHEDHFALLLLATVLIYSVACLGLNVQFGYAGIVNFAGAAFFGIGSYTAAMLALHSGMPDLLAILIAGLLAAALGSLLILPVLRTRGHYAALVTIAFGILFRTFMEVNDTFGGPQGVRIPSMTLFGRDLGESMEWGDSEISFYANFVILALILCSLAFWLVRRLERSWLGVSMDMVRTDEVSASAFGIRIARTKVMAFVFGNFLIGVAGASYGLMTGYVAPNNFTFGDSLILVSIVILGGIGNPWGIIPAVAIVMILPEKLQSIQEYRFLLYGLLVIAILLFRPQGLLPRQVRKFFPGRES